MRDLGVNEDISIPQIVVVGDQSSGKSSTLQAITHTPLAVNSELCTRFATQIVLRRTTEASVKVSIIPSSRTDEETKQHLLKFTREFSEEEFNEDGIFAGVINDAAEHMGLPTPGAESKDGFDKRFSGDVLQIEVFGPKQPHLSVVDVPGLFHNDTIYQTKQDLEIVRCLMKDYMDNPRSIILAVMDARVNLSNQEVFRLAREAGKDGSRTVGVITKCDALQRGDEKEVLNIAQNAVEKLTHGWFLVKNRSTQDLNDGVTLQERDVKEKAFFQAAPWNSLSKERVGVEPLTPFLSNLLLNHIKKEFPVLLTEIEAVVTKTQEQLNGYGEPRQTLSQQRRFLRRVATQCQKFVESSLNGVYLNDTESQIPATLRWRIRTENDAFAKDFAKRGHKWVFKKPDNQDDPVFASHENEKLPHIKDIYFWIRKLHNEFKGIELPGTVNPQLITIIFRKQTEPWGKLSTTHLSTVKTIVDQYLKSTLQKSFKIHTHSKADEELQKLLGDEREGVLQTVNHYLAGTLEKVRSDREAQRLKDAGYQEGVEYKLKFENVPKLRRTSNDTSAVHNIHDIVKSYYKVAMKRFLDNVIIQVVERHVLGLNTPLRLFSSDFVDDLEDDEIKFVAAESSSISMARSDLTTKLERLQKVLDIARGVLWSY
ncbi:hypothetical protein EYB26_006743 [Talaromyces marneffei]|uniref:uncharacterized protein n=1 Tax=Talaromyces marneffei TaxID=37727 RepID=UPI0012AAB98D|nr:uncharacterized protein EYB26_006743 [Talaromyces marneffei]QGA19055.1 hypothetical protein EYB26_006743 [Talaromyces marneffei]